MAEFTKETLFKQAKEAMGIFTIYQDKQLKPYFNDVIEYLIAAGVDEKKLIRESTVGLIARGMSDLWNYGAGEARLSEYFYQRASQLVNHDEPTEEGESDA